MYKMISNTEHDHTSNSPFSHQPHRYPCELRVWGETLDLDVVFCSTHEQGDPNVIRRSLFQTILRVAILHLYDIVSEEAEVYVKLYRHTVCKLP